MERAEGFNVETECLALAKVASGEGLLSSERLIVGDYGSDLFRAMKLGSA